MPTVINTNLASLFAQNSLSNAQNNLAQSVQRLSSGLRINSAKDDAAGLSISQSMQSQINGTNQSIRNLSDATNLLQVADSSLSTVQDMLLRMKQLTTQGYDGALSASQKLNIMQELIDLNNEINATAQRTQFNGINLLTSGASLDIVNTDVKQGATLVNSAVKVSTTSGLGASSTLADAGNTIYNISLDGQKSASGNNLTLTGSLGGKDQSQTIALASLVGYDPAVTQQAKVINTNVNFDNFGISINLTSSIASGTTETGAQLASAIVARSNTIQVDGKGGQISSVSLRGANPGTYQLSFENTGSISNLSLPASTVSGQVVAGTAKNVALVGGSGSGATADITYNSSGQITGLAVNSAGSGYKAGDVFSTAAISQGSVVAPTVTTIDGAGVSTESARVTFSALNAGEVITMAGLSFTAGNLGATAAQVANAFSNLANGAITGVGTNATNGGGSYSGTFNGWSTGAANGAAVQFTSTVPNANVADLVSGAASDRPVVLTTQGSSNITETSSVRFKALSAGQSFQLGGLTFTAGTASLTAGEVARAFMGLANGNNAAAANASNADRVGAGGGALSGTTGTFTAGTFLGWGSVGATRSTGVAANDTLVFTSSSANSDVTDLAPVGAPTITTTSGGVNGVTEQAAVTFNVAGLAAGETIRLGGLMFTAGSGALSRSQVAEAFANLANGSTTGAGTAYGTYSGALDGWTTGAANGVNGNIVNFTSTSSRVNVADLAAGVPGTGPTITTTVGGDGTNTEVATADFAPSGPLASGRTITLGGLTFTAGQSGATDEQLAAAFANLQNGVTGAQLNASGQSAYGMFSGTFSGWNTNQVAANGTLVTFTSSIPNTNVPALAAAVAGTAPSISIVQGQANSTESASATFVALSAGQSLTLGGLTYTSISGSTSDNVARAFAGLTSGVAPTNLAAIAEQARFTFANVTGIGGSATVTIDGRTITVGSGLTASANDIAVAFATGNNTGNAVVSGALGGTWTTGGAVTSAGVVTFTKNVTGNVNNLSASYGGTGTAPSAAMQATVTTAEGDDGGTYTGTFSGWNSAAQTFGSSSIAFTSNTPATDVSNLSAVLSTDPVVTSVNQGSAAATETALVTFNALSANQTVTLAGLTFTAGSTGATASEVASYFSTSGAYGVAGATPKGIMTGNRNGWTSTAASNGATLLFTSSTAGVNVTDLAAPISGTAPIIVTTQQGGSTSSTETAIVTFNAANMAAGDSVTLAGLTFTAGANGATRAQVAAAFSDLAAGTSSANLSSANGTFSGTLTGWSTGSSNGTSLTATSSTASQNVENLTASATQRSALNALTGIVVGGLANQTGDNLLTLRGTVNGNLQTQQIRLKDNAANSSQIIDFNNFGIQFAVDSFQAQSASDIGAALASLNSSSPSYGTSGAFKPGQIVVGQGANSALKFQSGADSEAFIQIDTLNIQTGKTGIAAGSDAAMMAVGDAITGSNAGNLGGLGVNDSINTWQTAFRNASAAVDAAIDYISSKRATFGSQMNRLGFITTNLTAQSTNLQNSRSAIIDTDFASETAKLTKGQIMQQAATAMLAQANQMPNVILSLLK
jgi:flagellin